jgi:hypothetical protein
METSSSGVNTNLPAIRNSEGATAKSRPQPKGVITSSAGPTKMDVLRVCEMRFQRIIPIAARLGGINMT